MYALLRLILVKEFILFYIKFQEKKRAFYTVGQTANIQDQMTSYYSGIKNVRWAKSRVIT